jgi:hypothetical protein
VSPGVSQQSQHIITIMQNPTDQAEASIPTNNGPDWKRTVNVRSKAAKRTHPFDLAGEQLNLVSPPHAEDIPARKRPRLEEPLLTTTDEATRETASPDVSVGHSPPTAADIDDTKSNANPVTDTQPNARATRAAGGWTFEEDTTLISAVENTSKKKRGKKDMIDWPAVATLVPGRTPRQCRGRWHDVFGANIGRATGRNGAWTAVEDSQLKDAVQAHGDKDWAAIAALVPGRSRNQCNHRWKEVLDPSLASGRKSGRWTLDEDSKLKDAVQTHGDKDWVAISLLVPGRTRTQCNHRWHDTLDPSKGRASGRNGKWTAVEDSKLKDAVQTHGDKDWVAISLLVPGRTKSQCNSRWHHTFDPSIALTAGRKGKWEEAEDSKLKDAVQTHGDKDWIALSALVPGRTRIQCYNRWHNGLDPNIERASGRTGKWAEDENSKLKDAVQTHGDKDWAAIAALVPGRTRNQCKSKWHNALHARIVRTIRRTGHWISDEDDKLKDVVQTHGEKGWTRGANGSRGMVSDPSSNDTRFGTPLDDTSSLKTQDDVVNTFIAI